MRLLCMDADPSPDPKSLLHRGAGLSPPRRADRAVDALTQAIDADPTDADHYFLRAQRPRRPRGVRRRRRRLLRRHRPAARLRRCLSQPRHGPCRSRPGRRRCGRLHRGDPPRPGRSGPAQRPRRRPRPPGTLRRRPSPISTPQSTLDPTAARVYFNRGQRLRRARQGRKSTGRLRRRDRAAIRSSPGPTTTAACACPPRQERRTAAIRDFSTALRLDPQLAEAFFHRGRALRRSSGDHAKAVADLTGPCVLGARKRRRITTSAASSGRRPATLDAPVADFTAALGGEPGGLRRLFNRGLTHLRRETDSAALARLHRGRRLAAGRRAGIRLYRGGVADDLGDTATGARRLRRVFGPRAGQPAGPPAARLDPPQAGRSGRAPWPISTTPFASTRTTRPRSICGPASIMFAATMPRAVADHERGPGPRAGRPGDAQLPWRGFWRPVPMQSRSTAREPSGTPNDAAS